MKKFIKKLAKKTEGFTLVELIVVIAILGILAGVAVPAYSGYLAKAKDASYNQVLGTVHTAASAATALEGGLTSITVKGDSGKYGDASNPDTVTIVAGNATPKTDVAAEFKLMFGGNDIPKDLEANWTVADGWKITKRPTT